MFMLNDPPMLVARTSVFPLMRWMVRQFDALIVDPCPEDDSDADIADDAPPRGPFDLFPEIGQGKQAAFEKFLFLGDDRNIQRVYVAGRRVL